MAPENARARNGTNGGLVGVDRDLLLARIRRVRQFGWPRSFPLVQFPNGPLVICAYEELTDGVNWFRHLLGLVYVVSTATHLAMAIRH